MNIFLKIIFEVVKHFGNQIQKMDLKDFVSFCIFFLLFQCFTSTLYITSVSPQYFNALMLQSFVTKSTTLQHTPANDKNKSKSGSWSKHWPWGVASGNGRCRENMINMGGQPGMLTGSNWGSDEGGRALMPLPLLSKDIAVVSDGVMDEVVMVLHVTVVVVGAGKGLSSWLLSELTAAPVTAAVLVVVMVGVLPETECYMLTPWQSCLLHSWEWGDPVLPGL